MRRASSSPSIPGIFTSVTSASISPPWRSSAARASGPFAASTTWWPASSSTSRTSPRTDGSSSATRTVRRVLARFRSEAGNDPGLLARQVDLEGRTDTGLALERDEAAALVHRPVEHRQAQAGSFPLRGEERLEDPALRLGIHPATGVADRDHRVVGACDSAPLRRCRVQLPSLRGDRQPASVGHRVACVQREVEQRLAQLRPVSCDDQVGPRLEDELDPLAEERLEEPARLRDDLVDVERLHRERLTTPERDELAGERGSRFGGPADLVGVPAEQDGLRARPQRGDLRSRGSRSTCC